MENFGVFVNAVIKYAVAYSRLERLQENPRFDYIPKTGDQKTGVIGEAFIFEYLKRKKHKGLEFGNAAQKVWDIRYPCRRARNGMVLVQVKTVSTFAKLKRISPIHIASASDYCELYLVSLNKQLIPDNIWKPGGVKGKKDSKVVKGTRLPGDKNDTASGFTKIENVFEDFKRLFPEIYG